MRSYIIATLLIVAGACNVVGQYMPAYKDIEQERLDRGLVAIRQDDASVVVTWRYMPTDDAEAAFDVYRAEGKQKAKRVNAESLTKSTFFIDECPSTGRDITYSIAYAGTKEILDSYVLTSDMAQKPYIEIPLQPITGDDDWNYAPNDASTGDLDGDGEYDIVIKREGRAHDNSHSGRTDNVYLEAYKLNGTMLWRVDLGSNIRAGAHYTQFVVYDFDGDGKSEVAVRTSERTIFGDGTEIGDVNNDSTTDYVEPNGHVLRAPEFLSVIEGATGKELARTDYISLGEPGSYGDYYGNRGFRFLAGMGYFDGKHPSILICRGYYARTTLEAWDYRNGELTRRWRFDTHEMNLPQYQGQGNHSLMIGDTDGDGRDEVTYGAMLVDDDGTPGYNTRLGHGDAMHVTDINIDRPGLEVWDCHESAPTRAGGEMRDARTGELLWGIPSVEDVGRAMACDIDPRFRGCEAWVISQMGVYTADGRFITERRPSINFAIWWDGDLNRELFNGSPRRESSAVYIEKWNGDGTDRIEVKGFDDVRTINGTKANPCLQADIVGDWREELLLRTKDNKALRLFVTSHVTDYRFHSLMFDPIYRTGISTQNVAYNQPPHTGFYLGSDLGKFKRERVTYNFGHDNAKSGRAKNGRPNGMNERMRHAVFTSVDTLVCYDNELTLDARCDYHDVTWTVGGKEIGKERQVVVADTLAVDDFVTVHVRAVQHGAIFEDDIVVNFTKRPRPKFPDVRD